VNQVINGKHQITPETAKGLASAFGTSPEYWLNLESAYQLGRSKGDDQEIVAQRAKIYSVAPVAEMCRRGWIKGSNDVSVLEREIVSFFEIASLDDPLEFQSYAARKSPLEGSPYRTSTPAQLAWLYRARKLARTEAGARFSTEVLRQTVSRLRQLFGAPADVQQVPRLLSEAGVRFLIVQALPGSKVDGACFWLDHQPAIALSLRFDRIDGFWFTLFHEIAHALDAEDSLDVDIDGTAPGDDRPDSEKRADQFAVEQLIPQIELNAFIARNRPYYSAKKIEEFAHTVGVHPGIVVGQLQHRQEISWQNLRSLLVPVRTWLSPTTLIDGWDHVLPSPS
jgi:HTH-type transcriptional regulator/antitoxin HigA